MKLTGEENLSFPEIVESKLSIDKEWNGVGTGISSYEKCFSINRLEDVVYPDALDILPIAEELFNRGETVSPEQALPVYLRDKVV